MPTFIVRYVTADDSRGEMLITAPSDVAAFPLAKAANPAIARITQITADEQPKTTTKPQSVYMTKSARAFHDLVAVTLRETIAEQRKLPGVDARVLDVAAERLADQFANHNLGFKREEFLATVKRGWQL
jgi:hypothetical protein